MKKAKRRSFRLNESGVGGIMRVMKTSTLSLALTLFTFVAAFPHGQAANAAPANAGQGSAVQAGASAKQASPLARHAKPAGNDHPTGLTELAALGNGDAQYQLGLSLIKTAEIKKADKRSQKIDNRHAEGLIWLSLAAVNGNVHAALLAAKEYEGHNETLNAARMWYRAGQLGDEAARAHFVDLVLAHKITTLEGPDGASWVTQRVQTTQNRDGEMILGDAFLYGKGIPVDSAQAQKWYMDAAMDGDLKAMVAVGTLELNDSAQWRALDKEVDRDGHHLPPSLWPIHWNARSRGGSGSLDMGREETAQSLDIDPARLILVRPGMVEGQSWLERAGQLKSTKALTLLAQAMTDGVTLPYDLQQATLLRQTAACAGDKTALTALARNAQALVRNTPIHPFRAWVYWDVAAAWGVNDAQAERDGVAKALSQRQIARAKLISQEWCANPPQ